MKNNYELKNLKDKIKSFGWHVERCDGHNFKKIESVFAKFEKINNKPKFLIADTIKGKGVSFMENSVMWHYKSLDKNTHSNAMKEII